MFRRVTVLDSLRYGKISPDSNGIGVQYQITPSIGIYAEPNLHYYFKTKHSIETIRTEKPFQVALPIGIRLSW